MADLRRAGVALRVCWEWLRRVDQNNTWQSLPDAVENSVLAVFKAATVSTIGSSESTLFWIDNWLQGASIRGLAPTVFAAVPRGRWNVTVAKAMAARA